MPVFYNCIHRLYYNTRNRMSIGQNPAALSHSHTNTPRTVDFRVKYKTEKCRYWEQQGFCPFGQMCAFAHFPLEMRDKGEIHQHYKTKPCFNFNKFAYCKYGDRCLFLHKPQPVSHDHDRTRSNSPAESEHSHRATGQHLQNLKILKQFGLGVFEAHMQRKSSRICDSFVDDECIRQSVSTEPELRHWHHDELDYEDEGNVGHEGMDETDRKKTRMNSM